MAAGPAGRAELMNRAPESAAGSIPRGFDSGQSHRPPESAAETGLWAGWLGARLSGGEGLSCGLAVHVGPLLLLLLL